MLFSFVKWSLTFYFDSLKNNVAPNFVNRVRNYLMVKLHVIIKRRAVLFFFLKLQCIWFFFWLWGIRIIIKDPGRGFRPNLIFLLEQVYVGENKLRKFHPSSSPRKVRASDQRMYCRNPQYCVNAYVTTLYLALYGVRLGNQNLFRTVVLRIGMTYNNSAKKVLISKTYSV